MVFGQLGFLGHDAGHHQVFESKRANYILGVLCGNLAIGLSYGWWTTKHNRHHAHPNTEDADPDIMLSVLAFSGRRARASRGVQRLVFRYQAYLLGPMLLLEGVGLHTSSVRQMTRRACKNRAWEAALLGLHVVGYLAFVFLVLSPVKAVVFIVIQQGLFGFYLGASFAPNHKGMPVLAAERQDRLPPPSGADLAQRQRRVADRLRPWRPELPDRAPPVPVDAAAQPAPVAGR